jgi:exopolysaccharide biosynthesis protein
MPIRSVSVIWLLCIAVAGCATGTPPPVVSDAALPFKVERFALPGPVAGVVASIDLADPRVQVKVALADDRDPDGAGPCVGQLDTTSSAARKHDLALAINASFFAAPNVRKLQGKEIRYFIGNCAIPEGWHFSSGKTVTRPVKEALRDVFIVHENGKISFHERAQELPSDTRYAVSGSAIVLRAGEVVTHPNATARHPRSAVGLSADGRTLLMVAVDGRQEHSRGVTLAELGQLMQGLGAADALNLDGGGSTALVVKDPGTGVFSIANQPSETSISVPTVHVERPVADVIGISLR